MSFELVFLYYYSFSSCYPFLKKKYTPSALFLFLANFQKMDKIYQILFELSKSSKKHHLSWMSLIEINLYAIPTTILVLIQFNSIIIHTYQSYMTLPPITFLFTPSSPLPKTIIFLKTLYHYIFPYCKLQLSAVFLSIINFN